MTILINLYNQVGAGPKNISLNLIKSLEQYQLETLVCILIPDYLEYAQLISKNENVKLIKLSRHHSLIGKVFFRVYLELIYIPCLIKKYHITKLLAFGNFLFTPGTFTKVVLLHHPYLFDDILLSRARLGTRLVERLKRVAFALTLKNVDTVVVQSEYVKEAFAERWKCYSKQLEIIPNPISDNFPKILDTKLDELIALRLKAMPPLRLLYVSRYYPHKNHGFLLLLSKALAQKDINHSIYVTLDSDILGVKEFMEQSQQDGLSIVNLSEMPQLELDKYYKTSHLFIFPSESETFGNPLVEAMKYGLPIVVPDLVYAHAVVGENGLYYTEDDVESCADAIKNISADTAVYQDKSYKSYERFQQFPTVSEWLSSYIRLVS
jgi:glycosyltransferase involved in cell wall biosynthesis